jgi:ubiquinone/menaquinone biosynthesis C-methylase UbiE
MIEAARRKATAAGADAGFLVADAAAPGLAHRTFDVVLARHVLWAMPDLDAARSRTRRRWPSGFRRGRERH